jgi:hypothetical protein
MTESTHYEMWYGAEGVSITEYGLGEKQGEAVVVEEWWFTWPEVFQKITGEDGHSPEVHSQ